MTEGADGEPRLGMLETIREYALERLEQDDDAGRARGAGMPSTTPAFAERAHDQLDGPAQLAALDRLEAEHDNLRAALAWSLETTAPAADPAGQGERAVIGLRLVQALDRVLVSARPRHRGAAVAAAGHGRWPRPTAGRRWPGWRTGSGC